ncbi:MAG TPA: hypothetical protein VIN71_00615 [Pseudomonadales bacterium]
MSAANSFVERLDGRFYGILQWSGLDDLWGKVRAEPEGWYAALTGDEPAAAPITPAQLDKFLTAIDALLRKEHNHNYCGVVYADDLDQPTLIKIFDPYNMGSGCRVGGAPIPPLWILSRTQPSKLEGNMPLTMSRKRWWNEVFGLESVA